MEDTEEIPKDWRSNFEYLSKILEEMEAKENFRIISPMTYDDISDIKPRGKTKAERTLINKIDEIKIAHKKATERLDELSGARSNKKEKAELIELISKTSSAILAYSKRTIDVKLGKIGSAKMTIGELERSGDKIGLLAETALRIITAEIREKTEAGDGETPETRGLKTALGQLQKIYEHQIRGVQGHSGGMLEDSPWEDDDDEVDYDYFEGEGDLDYQDGEDADDGGDESGSLTGFAAFTSNGTIHLSIISF